MSEKPEIPHGLLAQLERVRVEIERLAEMSTDGLTLEEMTAAWHVIDRLRTERLTIIQGKWYRAKVVARREASK